MKGLSKRVLAGITLGIAIVVVMLRRRSSSIDSNPMLPPPPPGEPPRIVLPTSVIEAAEPVPATEVLETHDGVPEAAQASEAPVEQIETSEAETVARSLEAEQATEAPLLEQAVGETMPVDMPPAATQTSDAAPDQPDIDEPSLTDDEVENQIGYCVACRTKRPMIDAHEEMTESGRRALRGTCPECGNTIFRFLPNLESHDNV